MKKVTFDTKFKIAPFLRMEHDLDIYNSKVIIYKNKAMFANNFSIIVVPVENSDKDGIGFIDRNFLIKNYKDKTFEYTPPKEKKEVETIKNFLKIIKKNFSHKAGKKGISFSYNVNALVRIIQAISRQEKYDYLEFRTKIVKDNALDTVRRKLVQSDVMTIFNDKEKSFAIILPKQERE